jgi:hypothetical protein
MKIVNVLITSLLMGFLDVDSMKNDEPIFLSRVFI